MAWEQESKRHSLAQKYGQAGSKKTSISPMSSVPATMGASKVFTSAKGVSVSEKEFEAYVKVQMSDKTNMFDVNNVEMLSGLDRDVIFAIMDNYEQLDKMFPKAKERVSEHDDDSHATNKAESEEHMNVELGQREEKLNIESLAEDDLRIAAEEQDEDEDEEESEEE